MSKERNPLAEIRQGTLGSWTIQHFDEPFGQQPLEQRQQIGLAALRLDIVLFQEGFTNLVHAPRLLNQLPDPRSNRVETVVHPTLSIEDRCLLYQVAGDLILGDPDDRSC